MTTKRIVDECFSVSDEHHDPKGFIEDKVEDILERAEPFDTYNKKYVVQIDIWKID